MTPPEGIEVRGPEVRGSGRILTDDALGFVALLHREFDGRRQELLARRRERQREFDSGRLPDFLPETEELRSGEWHVAAPPKDLEEREVEITGPTDRKMLINALNSGASLHMADFEDANTPSWNNMVSGQLNLIDAIERTIELEAEEKTYRLKDDIATLVVRPRGWHLPEKHMLVDGKPVSGSLFDFGMYFFHNARRLLDRGSGPYFYLPKLESHLEARLWNDVFNLAQDQLGIERGTVRATVLIETILAAFEMEEILYELRDHSSGLNAGRWDYIFSMIKVFRSRKDFILPDRAQVTMTVPFMRAYTELLVKTCHKRGAHAIGGMAAFIPSRKNPEVNEKAFAKVREDKERESRDGFDGSWVAHPDLVPLVKEVFDASLGDAPNQLHKQRDEVRVSAGDLLDTDIEGAAVTEEGLRNNVSVGLQYLSSWLAGKGAVGIFDLMEDAATCEISRSQIWQWVHNGAQTDDGQKITAELVRRLEDEELDKIRDSVGEEVFAKAPVKDAREVFERVALADEFEDFLTLPAYDRLD
ncbi:MAG TPA: malate synthase A [Actinomycetota bacterium]|jgi:malate synthase|nr:malate synthase A [Actinomycetota bacterium]